MLIVANGQQLPGLRLPSAVQLLEAADCSQLLRDQALLALAKAQPTCLLATNFLVRLLSTAERPAPDLLALLLNFEAFVTLQPLLPYLFAEEGLAPALMGALVQGIDLLIDGPYPPETFFAIARALTAAVLGSKERQVGAQELLSQLVGIAGGVVEALVDFAARNLNKLVFLEGFAGRAGSRSSLESLETVLELFCETARADGLMAKLSRFSRLLTFLRRARAAQLAGKCVGLRPPPATMAVFRLFVGDSFLQQRVVLPLDAEGFLLRRVSLPLDADYAALCGALAEVLSDIKACALVYHLPRGERLVVDSTARLSEAVAHALLADEGAAPEVFVPLGVEELSEERFQCISCGCMKLFHGTPPVDFNFLCNRCALMG